MGFLHCLKLIFDDDKYHVMPLGLFITGIHQANLENDKVRSFNENIFNVLFILGQM